MNTHRSIEPSWLPQTPVILYSSGLSVWLFCDDVDHREVGGDIGVHQRQHRQRDQPELDQRAGPPDRHPAEMAARRTDQRHGRLDERDEQCQDQREMAKLSDHASGAFSSHGGRRGSHMA